MPTRVLLLTAVVVLANVLGNTALKVGLDQRLVPVAGVGVLLLILWTLTRMALLQAADLSYVLPVTSAGYVLTALVGRFFLHEPVSPARWAGTALIVAGIACAGLTRPRASQ